MRISILALLLLISPLTLEAQDSTLTMRSKGKSTAPVTVYEMSDFQCPFCQRFALETFPAIEKDYINTGKVRWIFINYPLTSIHPNASPAAEYAMCAAYQGKFWPTHDALYARQEKWAEIKNPAPFFSDLGKSLGLRAEAMDKCLRNGDGIALVRSDAAGAVRSGANSTPSFFIEGGMMSGVHPIATWRTVLDSIIKLKSAK